MKFYSFLPGMKSTCKQTCFHPRTSFVPGWDFVSATCKRILNWLCEHMKNVRSNLVFQWIFVQNSVKHKFFHVSIVKDVSIAFRGFSKTLSKQVARQVDYFVFKPITQDNCDINSYLVEFGKLPKNHLIKVTWVCCKIWGIPQSPSDKF